MVGAGGAGGDPQETPGGGGAGRPEAASRTGGRAGLGGARVRVEFIREFRGRGCLYR